MVAIKEDILVGTRHKRHYAAILQKRASSRKTKKYELFQGNKLE